MRNALDRNLNTFATLRRTFAASLIFMAFLAAACSQVSSTADEHLARAEQAHANGRIRTAVIEIKNALQLEPDRADARRLLGDYYVSLGQGAEAEAELARAEALGVDPDVLRILGLRAWWLQGKHQQLIDATEAIDTYDQSEQTIALALRAQALLAEERLEEARTTLEQALSLDPENAEALLGLAWVDWLDNDLDATRAKLRAALDLDPALDRAWELLGDLEREAGQLEAAEAAYTKAIETTNQPLSPRVKRALTNLSRDDLEAVEEDVQVLSQQFASHPEVSFVRGLAALKEERYLDARRRLEESLYRDPNYVPALFYLGKAHYGLENWQQAESYLSHFISMVRDAPEATRLLASIRMQAGRTYSAEVALNAQLYRSNEDPDESTLSMISNLYLAQGRADEALHHLRRAIALKPESATTRAQLSLALMETGQRDEGLSELERAIELAPQDTERLELAVVLERLRAGEPQQALERLERLQTRQAIAPAVYYNLKGLAHFSLGETDKAESVFREGLERLPDTGGDLANNLARIMALDGRAQESEDLMTQALATSPDHLGLLISLAQLKAAANDAESTTALLERAISAHPAAQQPRLALAELYLRTNRPGDAVDLLRDGEQYSGRSAAWLQRMATARMNLGERQAAIDLLSELHERQPEIPNVTARLARLMLEQGERIEARSLLERALPSNPDHLETRLLLVELLTQEAKLEQAAKLLAPAQQSHPDHPQVQARAGAIAYNEARLQEALQHFQAASATAPNDRYITGALAQVQHETGDTDGARATLDAWLDRHPEDEGMRRLLANFQN